jgi:hypothetical protein
MRAALAALLLLAGCAPTGPRAPREEPPAQPTGLYLGGTVGSYVTQTR